MELAFCLWLLTTSELHLNGICTQAYEGISVKVHWICMTSKHQCGLQGPYQCGGGGWGSVGALQRMACLAHGQAPCLFEGISGRKACDFHCSYLSTFRPNEAAVIQFHLNETQALSHSAVKPRLSAPVQSC